VIEGWSFKVMGEGDAKDGSSLFLWNAGNMTNFCTVLPTKHIICVTFILFWSFCDIFSVSHLQLQENTTVGWGLLGLMFWVSCPELQLSWKPLPVWWRFIRPNILAGRNTKTTL
jgi:hypothetical protein